MKRFYIFLMALTLINCGGHNTNVYSTNDGLYYDKEKYLDEGNKNGLTDDITKHEQKIIYEAYLNLTVKNTDTINRQLKNIAKKYEGFVQAVSTNSTIIRVKSQFINEVVTDIETLGKVEYKNVSANNVTSRYVDLQLRLDNALNARKRYLELLKQAENVEAALKVEKELERLNYTIEQLKHQINGINRDAQYSKITINLKQKKKLGPLGFIFKGVYLGVKWLFVRG